MGQLGLLQVVAPTALLSEELALKRAGHPSGPAEFRAADEEVYF